MELAKPVKYTGKSPQGINPITPSDLNKCLSDTNIGLDALNHAQRHVVISVCKSVCVGFRSGEKTNEIRSGYKKYLDPKYEVKYKYIKKLKF